MERINIFGGTFNPAHVGHRAIARAVTEDFAEKLIIMPAGMPPHKDFVAAPPHIRMEMCELTAKGLAGAEVSDMELNGEKNYTFITAEKFLLKNIRPCFVIGTAFRIFPNGKNPNGLWQMHRFWFFPERAGRLKPRNLPPNSIPAITEIYRCRKKIFPMFLPPKYGY